MRKIISLIILTILFSCGNEKVILLPEINHSNITEIQDVSAAYLFYDETKKDSVELNRKNLISTTNWLVNVDKRLTLKQAIPHIKYLQEKKKNSSHKNKDAKNYFTCNDTSRKNLGFIEFTDVTYYQHEKHTKEENKQKLNSLEVHNPSPLGIQSSKHSRGFHFGLHDSLSIVNLNQKNIQKISINDLNQYFKQSDIPDSSITLSFHENLSFGKYIWYKSILINSELKKALLLNREFLHNN